MAQIVTITNPLTGQPAQVDQLDHTAQEIDDAIARALPGGDIDITLANKAPGGFGLGNTGKLITDCNAAGLNGWYHIESGGLNSPDSSMGWTILVTTPYNEATPIQDAFTFISTTVYYHLRRFVYPGSGTPWEWIDPPMLLGVEYRTTERYNGKPVFKVALESGALIIPGTTGLTGTWDTKCTVINTQITIVRPDGSCSTSPNFEDSTIYARHWTRTNGTLVIKAFNGLPTGTTVKAVISYVKD